MNEERGIHQRSKGIFYQQMLTGFAKRLWRPAIASVLLYSLLALVILIPLASNDMPDSPAQDLANHTSGIIEARNALAEGQFPIRVAPYQNNQERYPIFQFYGNFPYTVGGLLYIWTSLNPYQVWKLVIALSLVCGGFFTYCCAVKLVRQPMPSIVAGVVFITSPYLLTDIYGRFAYTEIVSFCLLPATFFYMMRSFASRRLLYIPLSAITWSLLALSHNITFLYASLFFSVYILSFVSFKSAYLYRIFRVGVGYILGILLTAWYFVPQIYMLPQLILSESSSNQYVYDNAKWMTPLRVLLSPTLLVPTPPLNQQLNNAYFGPQVGWPIIMGVAIVLYCLYKNNHFTKMYHSRLIRTLVFLLWAVFMVWTPFNFWSYLPNLLGYVQFSYRLLMFVVLWGAFLAAYGIFYIFKHNLKFRYAAIIIAMLMVYTIPYLAPHSPSHQILVNNEIEYPNMGRGGANSAYEISSSVLQKTTVFHNDINLADWEFAIVNRASLLLYPGTGVIPSPKKGAVLLISGYVPKEYTKPITLTVSINNSIVAQKMLELNGYDISIPIRTSFPGERVSVKLQTDRYLEPIHLQTVPPSPGMIALVIRNFELKNPVLQSSELPLISLAKIDERQIVNGVIKYNIQSDKEILLKMPILFYPNMIKIHVDDNSIGYGNIGRFVVLRIPAGNHNIDVIFNGISWANIISLMSWIYVFMMILYIMIKFLKLRLVTRLTFV